MQPWLEPFADTAFRRSADTAHDLKTPLNVAILNLELLRMRLAKLIASPDDKATGYAKAIEAELRRMARIFDTFFLLSTPPKEGEPELVDVAPLCDGGGADGPIWVSGHETRIREVFRLLFDGASRVLSNEGRSTTVRCDQGVFELTISGLPLAKDVDLSKLFKFYYSGPDGNPDLSLSTARLVAETYGGALVCEEEHDKVLFRLTFPLGEK